MNPIVVRVLYIVVIVLLLAGLCFFYMYRKKQKESFQEMRSNAASKETVRVLEPKQSSITEDGT
jgi:preprotein translocase subunit SecG